MEKDISKIIRFFEKRDIDLRQEQARLLLHYRTLILEENNKRNLTRITEEEQMLEEHFYDSVAGLKQGHGFMGDTLVDIGTGAGFPGIPINIVLPNVQITLLESSGKKAAFLRLVVRELKLKHVQVVQERAEDYGQNTGRERFSWATARALAPLVTGIELTLPLVKTNGYLWAYKGNHYQDELTDAQNIIQRCGGRLEKVVPYTLQRETRQRHILIFKKEFASDKAFPRRSGVPHKRPWL